jgi:hypothetical protein
MREIDKLKESYKGQQKLELKIPEIGEATYYVDPLTVKDAQKILGLFNDKKEFEGLVECCMKLMREDGSSVFLPSDRNYLMGETSITFVQKYGNEIAQFYLSSVSAGEVKKNS